MGGEALVADGGAALAPMVESPRCARPEAGTVCCVRRPLGCGSVRLSSCGLMRPAGRKLLASVLPPLAHRAAAGLFQGPQCHNCSSQPLSWSLRGPLGRPCNFCRSNSAAALPACCSLDSLLCEYRHRCHLSSHASPRSSARPRHARPRRTRPRRARPRGCRTTCQCRRRPLI